MEVKKLSEKATLPCRKSEYAAGYDLFSAEDCVIAPSDLKVVSTDIAIAIPEGHYGRVAPRSGLAIKFIDVGAGVIDSDYRGCIGVVLYNHSTENHFQIKVGDRIAQLIIEKISTPQIIEVTELPPTKRGSNGFGSTGR